MRIFTGSTLGDTGTGGCMFPRRRRKNTTHPRISRMIPIPPTIIIVLFIHIDIAHFPHSICLNTRNWNPISSFPIFIPNVIFRRSDSSLLRALSSCTMTLSEMISDMYANERNRSSDTHSGVRSADGKVGSFLRFSHISRVEPVRLVSFFGSILTIISLPVPERMSPPIS